MFKALLLQSWYNLSDPRLENLLVRDLLFRRFVNLSLADSVPDHSSTWRFRQLLEKQGLMDSLLTEINRQLSVQGFYIRAGEISIVDASVIQAQRNRPPPLLTPTPTYPREAIMMREQRGEDLH